MKVSKMSVKEIVEGKGKCKLIDVTHSKADFYMTDLNKNGIGLVVCEESNLIASKEPEYNILQSKIEPLLFLAGQLANPVTKKALSLFIFIKFADGLFSYRWNADDGIFVGMDSFDMVFKIPTAKLVKVND